ncbi:MAG: hypothetical protein RLZZ271_681 [Pseudomonadota bacterium]|jgi:aconitate hydratase 2/2-methylisocitrate dehydratase
MTNISHFRATAVGIITATADQIYKYMNFNQIEEYVENAKAVA